MHEKQGESGWKRGVSVEAGDQLDDGNRESVNANSELVDGNKELIYADTVLVSELNALNTTDCGAHLHTDGGSAEN